MQPKRVGQSVKERRTKDGRTRRDDQKDATREQLLDGATRLLANSGYAAFRVAAVAKEAGVSLGGMLHHFPSKDSMVIAVLERLVERVMQQAGEDAAQADSDGDLLTAIAKSAERFYSASEFLIFLDIFLSVRRHAIIGSTAVHLLTSQRSATEALWTPHLTARGITQKDAVAIVRALWGLSRGLAISSDDYAHQGHEPILGLIVESLRNAFFPR